MRTVRIGVIGYGLRGGSITRQVLLTSADVKVVAICDEYEDRAKSGADDVEAACGTRPYSTTDYKALLRDMKGSIDCVYVATSWETHVEIAVDALLAGIPVALEVGGAYTVESLWQLVEAEEKTKVPFMFMENCCFGKDELLATSLVRRGVLGDIVHCHGAYGHYLAEEIASGEEKRHYRLRNYLYRNCENYPTHELGPIARILNINRGNRMVSLVSVASRSAGMKEYVRIHSDKYPELVGREFAQGDIVNTIITCADGSTISLRLDTTLPRPYSREFTVRGTRGLYEQGNNFVHLLGEKEGFNPYKIYKEFSNNATNYEAEFMPRVWKEMTEEKIKAGHGGMDGIEFDVFFDCLRSGAPMPIDVYDAAAWMVITALSEESIRTGGMPQEIPDFTRGEWQRRQPCDVVEL